MRDGFACLSAFSPPRSISLNFGVASLGLPQSAWSLLLVLPGLWLRAYASGYVKKNRELTQTGPYAYTRNPLYLGSILIAAGFAVALLSWPVAAMLTAMFLIIYVPVIASEERFLRVDLPGFRCVLPSGPAPDSTAHSRPLRPNRKPKFRPASSLLICI